MIGIRAHASEEWDDSASAAIAPVGVHALRPGIHRRRRSRATVSLSTATAVMIAAVVVVMGNGHSAVADENTPTPQPSESVVAQDPTPTPSDGASVAPTATASAPSNQPTVVKTAQTPSKKLSKAAAHQASVTRASRAGRRGTKVYNIVYTATFARTAMGWPQREINCLTKLWAGESNFRPMARNRNSGAYGIPQALPGRKMREEGNDWKTNPDTQIRWGVKYVKGRYGTPCKALKVKRWRGWY